MTRYRKNLIITDHIEYLLSPFLTTDGKKCDQMAVLFGLGLAMFNNENLDKSI